MGTATSDRPAIQPWSSAVARDPQPPRELRKDEPRPRYSRGWIAVFNEEIIGCQFGQQTSTLRQRRHFCVPSELGG